MILPSKEFWLDLWSSARGEIIGGLVVAILGTLAAVIWKTFRKGISGPAPDVPSPVLPPQPQPQPQQPQEVVLRIEGAHTSVPPPAETPPLAIPINYIPRPPLAGFVARRDENGHDIIERLKSELAPEKEQLMVLWGAGGLGKTTLAAETVRAMRSVFPGGVAWITADGKPDFGLSTLLDEIATHLGQPEFRQLAPDTKSEQVHRALANAPATLVVLDNFETISLPEQERCAQWLAFRASCPALITSRNEVTHARPVQIHAMSFPEAREFLKRLIANARNPRAFEPLNQDQIIAASDRNPLVLQWLVKQIDSARQPQSVLDDLSSGKGDAAERVFDRSFDLAQVKDDGRATLLALSLFVPSASRAALAEAAGFGNDLARLDLAVQQLAELWLIEASEANERLRVQGLTRELTKARLKKSGASAAYANRFVDYFLQLVKTHSEATAENYDVLEADKDNTLAAIDIAFELEAWETVRGFAYIVGLPVSGVFSVRGFWDDAIKVNEQALEAARQSKSQLEISRFAHNLAVMYDSCGERTRARLLLNESLDIVKVMGLEQSIAMRLHQLGSLALYQGEIAEARRLYNESLEIEKKLENEIGVAKSLHQLAILAYFQGEAEEAQRLSSECLAIANRLGDNQTIALVLLKLGMHAEDRGEIEEAQRLYSKGLATSRQLGNQQGIAKGLLQLGTLALRQGKIEEARTLYDESLGIARKLRDQSTIATALHQLGILAHSNHNFPEARRLFQESLAIEKKLGNQHGIGISLDVLGDLAEREGDLKEAERLYSEALAIFDKLNFQIAQSTRENLERVKAKISRNTN